MPPLLAQGPAPLVKTRSVLILAQAAPLAYKGSALLGAAPLAAVRLIGQLELDGENSGE